jgi:hypothetical protein
VIEKIETPVEFAERNSLALGMLSTSKVNNAGGAKQLNAALGLVKQNCQRNRFYEIKRVRFCA